MGGFASHIRDEILDHVLRGESYTPPTALYIGLFDASTGLDDNNSGTWSEESYTGYARQTIRSGGTNLFDAASSNQSDSNARIEFPVAQSNGGTPTHVALLDASTAGNVIAWGALTMTGGSRQVETGMGVVIESGDLYATLSGA